ncbi:MAG: hypothetical protein ACRDNW_15225 [Trebonia sp.]
MSDLDHQAMAWHPELSYELPEGLLVQDDYPDIEEELILDDGPVAGLVSIRYIWAALRRRFRLWGTLGVVGLVLGAAWYNVVPPPYHATATVLLVDSPTQDPLQQIQIDTALATSTAVANGIISQLGLQMSPSEVLTKYTVTSLTSHAVSISAGAKTSEGAVQLASAVATQFLKYRAAYAETQQQQTEKQLNRQAAQAQQHLNSISGKVAQVSAQPSTPTQQSQLKRLQAQQASATTSLGQVQQYVAQTAESTRTNTQAMVQGSQVLNEATLAKRSFLQTAAFYTLTGLLAGLALGIAIVVIAAVTSDRLRRRDDVARAFGAPVRLSVGPLHKGRWPTLGRRRTAAKRRDRERVVQYLRDAVPPAADGPAGLAVVAVDDAPTVARTVVALAVSSAKRGKRVAVADLSVGAYAARLLGMIGTGSARVGPEGVSLQVLVPSVDDIAPTGPLEGTAAAEEKAPGGSLAAACAGADLVLSLATLDPAVGADHLATWATDVVAVVTTGESTGVRVNAVGEMLRLAGVRRTSVILVGADKSDESLGAVNAIYSPASL